MCQIVSEGLKINLKINLTLSGCTLKISDGDWQKNVHRSAKTSFSSFPAPFKLLRWTEAFLFLALVL